MLPIVDKNASQKGERPPFDVKNKLFEYFFVYRPRIISDYYEIEKERGTPPDSLNAQVSAGLRFESETTTKNVGGVEDLFIPAHSKKIVTIFAPPIIPYPETELMPQELWEVSRSGDPSRVQTFPELKCIEISIVTINTFGLGKPRETQEIYRIDLTRGDSVLYQRFPLPNDKKVRNDAMGTGEEAEALSAMLDFIQPLPEFEYKQVNPDKLYDVFRQIEECKNA